MSDNRRLNTPLHIGDDPITTTELKNILEVNHKAISIYIEVERQNEEILKSLKDLEGNSKRIIKDLSSVKDGKTETSGVMQASLMDSLELAQSIESNLKTLLTSIESQNKNIVLLEAIHKEIIENDLGERLDQIKEIHEKVTEIHSTTESVNFIEIHQNTKSTKDDVFKLTIAFTSGILLTLLALLSRLLFK